MLLCENSFHGKNNSLHERDILFMKINSFIRDKKCDTFFIWFVFLLLLWSRSMKIQTLSIYKISL